MPLGFALAGLAGALFACGQNRPPPAAAPHVAPARDVVIRTGRFAIHVNAYVSYYARSLPLDAEGGGQRPDPDVIAKLGACSDDRCAREAFGGLPSLGGLDEYLRETWPDDADDARHTIGRAGTPLMDLEDLIAPALATQMGRLWPTDPVVVYLARAPGIDPSGREGALIDTQGECFERHALLECMFTRAFEAMMGESELGKGVEEARASLDATARAGADAAIPCVAALAVDAAVSAADPRFEPTRRFVEACPEGLRSWLADAWAKRIKKEMEPKDFGAKLVGAMAARKP